jgi:hypothetical protein
MVWSVRLLVGVVSGWWVWRLFVGLRWKMVEVITCCWGCLVWFVWWVFVFLGLESFEDA